MTDRTHLSWMLAAIGILTLVAVGLTSTADAGVHSAAPRAAVVDAGADTYRDGRGRDNRDRGAPDRDRDRDRDQASKGVSLDEAIDMAQKRYRARVVRADTTENDGRRTYVLRLLSDDDGRVWTVRVDAATGAMR